MAIITYQIMRKGIERVGEVQEIAGPNARGMKPSKASLLAKMWQTAAALPKISLNNPAETADEFAARAKEAARGFNGLKWDPFGLAYKNIGKKEQQLALGWVGTMIEPVGDEVDILIEGHDRFNVPTAVRIGHTLANFDITWFGEA